MTDCPHEYTANYRGTVSQPVTVSHVWIEHLTHGARDFKR